jgi:nicotinate-nucleotide--dimethylbenzimidazole phosphoribosyltransferase
MEDIMSLLADTVADVTPLHGAAVAEARERQQRLTKPGGSLGVLEDLSAQLASLAGECPARVPRDVATFDSAAVSSEKG